MIKIAFVCLAFLLASGAARSQSEMLSVEETVRIAQVMPAGPVDEDTMTQVTKERLRGNPEARTALHRLLSESGVSSSVPYQTIVSYFAYIGQPDDIQPLTKIYDGEIKNRRDHQLVLGSFYALAGMTARGVPGAKEKLDQISHWSFWNERKIRFGPDSPEGLTGVNFVLRCVLGNRCRAFEEDYVRIVEAAITEIPDETQRQRMKAELRAILSAQEARMKSSKRALFQKCKVESAPGTKGASTESVPVKPTVDTTPPIIPQDDISRVIDQALAAYSRVSGAFVEQAFEKAVPWLADNKKPCMDPEMPRNDENVKKYVEVFRKQAKPADIEVTANMVKAWKALGGELGPAEVEMAAASKFVEVRRGSGEYGPITHKLTTIVRIPCVGSEAIGQKYVTVPLSPRCRSMTRSKGLVILMIKIGDDWFWEPFGW